MVKRLAGAALFFAFVAGCDPGLRYMLPGSVRVKDNGARYVVGVNPGVDVRFHSNVFIQEGWVEIEVLNKGTAPIHFERTPPVIANGWGTPLEPSWCTFQNLTSQTTARDIERRDVIERGQRALVTCRFPVRLGHWSTYPPESRRVSFTQPGFTQSGRSLDIHATMVAE